MSFRSSTASGAGFDAAAGAVPGQDVQEAHLTPAEQALADAQKRDARRGYKPARKQQGESPDVVPVSKLHIESSKSLKAKIAAGVAAIVAVFAVSMCVEPEIGGGFMSPVDVLAAVGMHFKLAFQALSGNPANLNSLQVIEQCPAYFKIETRFAVTLVTLVCGFMLALAGSLYQMVFRNPIAAPTMLGVSNGVSLGVVVFVLVFQQAALNMDGLRWAYSYVGAVIALLLVLLITKLACGKGKAFSVFELLLVGTIFSQVCGAVVQVIQDSVMSDELWEVYQQVSEATSTVISPAVIAVVLIAALATCIPLFMMRFSINMVAFTDRDSRLMGLDPAKLKVACLVIGTVMVITAQVTVGTVSMVALVVPFISRAIFGTEFKRQMWGDIILGALLLLVCRDFVLLVPFFGTPLTLSSVVGFVALPAYVWVIASKQRGWD